MKKEKLPEGRGITPFDHKYYDRDYFETGSKQIVDRKTGKKTVWGYHGTDWSGHYHIVMGILKTFSGEIGSVLDVGAGQGSFTDYALRAGLVAKGCDFSEFAVKTAHHFAKGNMFCADVTKGIPEEEGAYDLIFCSDMLEHIQKSKVRKVIEEFHRITRKWVFLQFPVSNSEVDIFDAETAGEDHRLYAHCMISGHLNMELRSWWDKLFVDCGFKVWDNKVLDFRTAVPREVILNWMNIVILEKVNGDT